MKKRIVSAFVILVLLLTVLPMTVFASGGLDNFVRVHTYKTGQFTDISSSKWYTSYVQASYEYGLVNGRTAGTFAPDANLTLGEAVKLAACLHSIYAGDAQDFSGGAPWYRPYADYAFKNGIIPSDFGDYNASATRAEFAEILSQALPEDALSVKNSVDDDAIPDVLMTDDSSTAIYALYRAGVLTGGDAAGNFFPDNNIKRAEVAAVVTRMANVSYRQTVTLRLRLTAAQLYNKCAPAVFYILIYDIKGTPIKSGSGFFIDGRGLAVTNYHVISGAAKAVVTTYDGKQYDVGGIYDFDKDKDLALLQVNGGNFASLEMGDSDTVVTGQKAYAIGSPLGYKNTISDGIISAALRVVDGQIYMQTTAAVSSGSSGGALFDETGKVIGVTTATAVGAQNINLAKPINLIKDFDRTNLMTLQSILPDTKYYDNAFPAPDFGAYADTPLYQTGAPDDAQTYYYKVSDLRMALDDALDGYAALLVQNCFSFYGYAIEDGRIVSYYLNSNYGLMVTFGEKVVNGTDCIRIQIMNMG